MCAGGGGEAQRSNVNTNLIPLGGPRPFSTFNATKKYNSTADSFIHNNINLKKYNCGILIIFGYVIEKDKRNFTSIGNYVIITILIILPNVIQ